MLNNIVNTIVDSLTAFVTGIGGAFVEAFETMFTTTGSNGAELNSLGITVLVFGGMALGYGVIRYIMGFFRKES